VKTEFGYHIIRLDGIQPGATKSFEEARADIDSELRRDQAADRFGDIEEQLAQRLEEGGIAFDALAKEFNLQTGEVARFERGTGGAPLGSTQELQDIVFGTQVLADRRIGGPVQLGEDRVAIVRVLDHKPAAPKPIAEVRDQIVSTLRTQRGTEAALKAAQAAQQKLESGSSLDDVARETGVTAEPARFVGRGDPSIPAQVRELVFDSPRPTQKPVYRSIQLDTGGAALVAIIASKVDSSGSNPELEATRKQQAAAQHGVGDVIAYMEEARRTADVDKNPQIFE
jgi:peptidyl-prolyl cis-trans isomerase D